MQNEVTYEAAIIEANRAKNPEKRVTDYNHRAKCMDILIEAARFRISKKPEVWYTADNELSTHCPNCNCEFTLLYNFCFNCGQALDWS